MPTPAAFLTPLSLSCRSCYDAPNAGSDQTSYKSCTADDQHGKTVKCNYLSNDGEDGAEQWAAVGYGENAPQNLYAGCSR